MNRTTSIHGKLPSAHRYVLPRSRPIQLDKYETAPYFFLLNQTWHGIVCWFFFLNLPDQNPKLFCFDVQNNFMFRSDKFSQIKVKTQKSVSHLFSCKIVVKPNYFEQQNFMSIVAFLQAINERGRFGKKVICGLVPWLQLKNNIWARRSNNFTSIQFDIRVWMQKI